MSINSSLKPPASPPPLLNYQSSKSPPKVPPNFKSSDFVSKLLAATPPYLYNIPLVPQNFFFSEMLKSFVQARNQQSAKLLDSTGLIGHLGGKKGRKRLWQDMSPTNNNYLNTNHNCLSNDVKKVEPLELTKNNTMTGTQTHGTGGSHAFKKLMRKSKVEFPAGLKQNGDGLKQESESQNIDPAYNMMPPPLPGGVPTGSPVLGAHAGMNQAVPGFNPGLGDVAGLNKFSPFWNYWNSQQNNLNFQNQLQGTGFDPLHFFIDLRVSGHIYDKKLCAEGVNANEPLNLQKQNFDPHQNDDQKVETNENNNNAEAVPTKIEMHEDNKKSIKQENTPNSNSEKQADENEINYTNNDDLKRNSAFNVPNNNNSEIENQNIANRRTLKGNIKTKTNYGINYILNNLPKIYKNFNEEAVEDLERDNATTNKSLEETRNYIDSKDFKYLKSYHNNLRCNKNVYTFQNNYEHFTKVNAVDQSVEGGELNDYVNRADNESPEALSEDIAKTGYAARVHLNITKDSSDDEDIYRDIRNDFVDVENSESDNDDINNSDEEFPLRQET